MADKNFRHELKRPDEFQSLFTRFLTLLAENQRVVLILLVLIAVSGASFIGWNLWREKQDAKAADVFQKILDNIPQVTSQNISEDKPEKSWAKVLPEIDSFLSQHGGSSLAGVAYLYKGRGLMQEGKVVEAAEIYRKASSKLKFPYRYLSQEGEAIALAQQKKWNEAEALFSNLSKAEDNPLRAQHSWNLGLVQEAASRTSQALATYQDFEKRFADSPLLERVRTRIAALSQPAPKS